MKYLTNKLGPPSASPAAVHPDSTVILTNTSLRVERENIQVLNYLNQLKGGPEVVRIPTRTVTSLRKTGLIKQTKTQDEKMTPGRVKAGATKMLRGTTDQTGRKKNL